ncbi:class I SAM-dependent methyltransferase [Accumulibacter sp.]|uniref:class I SAM-dependent methyltransferase n=1 Tax=Accumulibacter sp. TaxID=2053492 RepID=UPI0025E6CE98|nr:class I SAM-dependent methyltransferase [Accumulibacter sp.]MCM8596072.1 class I SAM-dependent methyltransferase [Accumulibacter sp.]MCM8627027.1 class I SAM-dependent methyltransferase [Accumulibacter sp.]MDS4050221.1 class I SAM-dependent methyltransferase [Accumulibacter sp.]
MAVAGVGENVCDVGGLGQVFTPLPVVEVMLGLVRNRGRILEPACGDGAFLRHFPSAVGIEIDARHAPTGARVMDFFDYPQHESFATIIGNPPYVRYQDIAQGTRRLIRRSVLDGRSNLYLLFIEKCLHHLAPGGELVLITPRDFVKATSAVPLNRLLHARGTITDFVELGDSRLFAGATPNCAIWRFELGNFSRRTRYAAQGVADGLAGLARLQWDERRFIESGGHLLFTRGDYPLRLSDIAFVKVGAVSGADDVYASDVYGNRSFVCSETVTTGTTRRMLWIESGDPPPAVLLPFKERLLARRVRPFDESNWWHWGRGYYQSDRPRVYVNARTRRPQPFFVHPCPHYDGAVLAIFAHDPAGDVRALAVALNGIDWDDLGFVCDGRFLFTQRSLEQTPLPVALAVFAPARSVK